MPPTCAWSIRRTRRSGIRPEEAIGGIETAPNALIWRQREARCLRRLSAERRRTPVRECTMETVDAKGLKMPLVGLGTWTLRGRECARLTEQAIRIGYRHIDTAQMYDNEREVGEGVRAVRPARRGDGHHQGAADHAGAARSGALGEGKPGASCGSTMIDLLLIHWPNPRVPLAETLGAMAKMKTRGLHARHRRLEFHRGAARRGEQGLARAAGLQPDRMPSRFSTRTR